MMPWNRKEVWMGSDEQFFSKLKSALSESQIKYQADMKNAWSGGRGLDAGISQGIAARYGEPAQANTYYVYVHKYDYEKAMHTLRKAEK